MNILIAVAAMAAAQTSPAAPVDHSQHSPAQHAQHQQATGDHAQHKGEHKCCKEVNGKMECQMMKGHGALHQGENAMQGHEGHGSSHQ